MDKNSIDAAIMENEASKIAIEYFQSFVAAHAAAFEPYGLY
jgi:hypothetical protein